MISQPLRRIRAQAARHPPLLLPLSLLSRRESPVVNPLLLQGAHHSHNMPPMNSVQYIAVSSQAWTAFSLVVAGLLTGPACSLIQRIRRLL